ncbi:winged helix-turn-helix domain-containing protein [Nonomuraea soli]|uniref:DNA-binding transcriptional ArsR family regulator n=1 Tax=Nonomuraea soli TaxID=1032476 RepID=A0A7W0HSS3_9ACTN|nr:winged helix-turn-helix domain-containing protein [Nonomuraea soli]MBA2894232.1 DNA-binding transcriptional ArsR family regulator [Nonomuraea soli]
MDESYVISDPRVLKVVAHPLRVRLLGLLRAEGPATASQLGRKVDESSGSTSYHLRELAKFGFIEEEPSSDGRERLWRARHQYTSWDSRQMSETPEGREALSIMEARQIEGLARVMGDFRNASWPADWIGVAGMSDYFVRLSAAGVREFHRRLEQLREEMEREYGDGAEDVSLYFAAYPRRAGQEDDDK